MAKKQNAPPAEEWLRPEGLEKLKRLAAECTVAQIADEIGVTRNTLYSWRRRYPEIKKAIDEGMQEPGHIEAVEGSLYQRAIGFKTTVKKAFKIRYNDYDPETGKLIGSHEEVELFDEEEYFEPDVGAIKFYLTNRAPERWKNKVEYDPDAAKREPELTTAEKLAMLKLMGLTLPGNHNPGPPAHDSGTKGAGPLCETPGDGR